MLTFIDRLTFTAVTTGFVCLPNGRDLHAGVWLRLLRTLVDDVTRPICLLGAKAYRHVRWAWREAGFCQREPLETIPQIDPYLTELDLPIVMAAPKPRHPRCGPVRNRTVAATHASSVHNLA